MAKGGRQKEKLSKGACTYIDKKKRTNNNRKKKQSKKNKKQNACCSCSPSAPEAETENSEQKKTA